MHIVYYIINLLVPNLWMRTKWLTLTESTNWLSGPGSESVVLPQVLEQQEGGVAKNGPTDVNVVEGVWIKSVWTVQIWSDFARING